MWTECKLILVRFLLLISNKYPALPSSTFAPWYLISVFAPRSLPSLSPVELCFILPYTSVYLPLFDALKWIEMQTGITLSVLMKLWCQNYPLPKRMQTWNLLQRLPFLILFPLYCMNLQKYFSLNIHQAEPCIPNPPKILLPLWSPEIPPSPHATSKMQNIPNYHFHLGLLSADESPSPHYDPPPPPSVSIKSTNFYNGRAPSF